MEKQFWFKSWELEGHYTSFHRRDIHPFVMEHLTPEVLTGKSIFVPLCGKAVDMVYFSLYAERVIGVEIVEKAVFQFFDENKLSYERIGNRFVSGNITIFCADMFTLTPEEVGEIDLVYDRASLVALPFSMRMNYLRKLEELTQPGCIYFLNTLEYAPTMDTPPFSIPPAEVERYFSNYAINHVESSLQPNHGMVHKFGLEYLIEHGFMMQKLYGARRSLTTESVINRYSFSYDS
ncbi:thiopurine S-methyltransferase [Nibrella saemangeumensis]|uniref:thiopurine S-methyltransferase n=1 Tax=Nibrella saemangeumensis TaxID=1084526 RepID=A0ABP8NJG7_9BACT